MAQNNNIDERFRKPRRAKGTPFYSQRNYVALGFFAVSGLSWYLYELYPPTKTLKRSIGDGKFDDPPALKERILHVQVATGIHPELKGVLAKVRQREEDRADGVDQKQEDTKSMPWYIRMFYSSPEFVANSENISKYFTETAKGSSFDVEGMLGSGTVVDECLDSPYKSSLKEIHCQVNDSLSDEKDFMSPLVLPKKKPTRKNVILGPVKTKTRQRVKREKKKVLTFQKTIEDSFKYLDVNADHLQMAVALSKSAQLAQSDEQDEENSEELILPTTEFQPKTSLRSTLEKFGFRHGTVRNTISTFMPHETLRKKKKSKFSHVTPTLLLRTEEDREALITSKVSQVLSGMTNILLDSHKSQETLNIFSKKLQLHYSETKKMFIMNSMGLTDLKGDRLFHTKSLLLSSDKSSPCGCLLRNWHEIPGREASPPRGTVSRVSSFQQCPVVQDRASLDQSKVGTCELVNGEFSYCATGAATGEAIGTESPVRTQGCVSPDLFSDDDHPPLCIDQDIPRLDEKLCSKFTLEEFEEEDNGICHYESFHGNKVILSKGNLQYCIKNKDQEALINSSQTDPKAISEIYDLTLSSDDEPETNEIIFNRSNNPLHQIDDVSNNEQIKGAYPDPTELSPEKAVGKKINKTIGLHQEKEIFISDCDELTKTVNSSDDVINKVMETENHLEDDIMNEDTIIVNNFNQYDLALSTDGQSPIGGHKLVDSDNFDLNFSKERNPNITMINTIPNEDRLKVTELSPPKTATRNVSTVFGDLNIESCNRAQPTFEVGQLNEELQESDVCSSQAWSQELHHISDEELNYSSNVTSRSSKVGKKLDFFKDCNVMSSTTQPAAEVIILSDEDSCEHDVMGEQRLEIHQVSTDLLNDSVENVLGNLNITALTKQPTDIARNVEINTATPVECAEHSFAKENTPKNKVIIKTEHVTPIPDYDFMDTPKILKELHRFGVKPLKRQRGVQLLKYIYDSTHPIVGPHEDNSSEDDDVHRELKKQKRCGVNRCNNDIELGTNGYQTTSNIEIIGDIVLHSSNIDELIFERRQSSRVPSCRIPLDIVWHNFVSSNQQIRENILLYEPLQLEVLHSMLKEDGYKFHIQDLLKFLDRKCITVRVAGSQGHKRQKN